MGEKSRIEDIQGSILATERVGHVTFYLIEDKMSIDEYFVYSESKDQGLKLLTPGEYGASREEAEQIFRDEVQRMKSIIEKKRKGMPTANQLHFLFCEKIPIPLTLTWGEASDLIDERINQIEYEKEVKKKAKEEQRTKKKPLIDTIEQWRDALPFHPGDKVQHPLFGAGTILHAGRTLAKVRFQSSEEMLSVAELTK